MGLSKLFPFGNGKKKKSIHDGKPSYSQEDALKVVLDGINTHFARKSFFERGGGITVEGGTLFARPLDEYPQDIRPTASIDPFVYTKILQSDGRPIPSTYAGVFGREYSDGRPMFPHHRVNLEHILNSDKVFQGNLREFYEHAGQNFDDGSFLADLYHRRCIMLESLIESAQDHHKEVLRDQLLEAQQRLEFLRGIKFVVEGDRPSELRETISNGAKRIFELRPMRSEEEATKFYQGIVDVLRGGNRENIPKNSESGLEAYCLGEVVGASLHYNGGGPYLRSLLEACKFGQRDPKVFGKAILETLYSGNRFVLDILRKENLMLPELRGYDRDRDIDPNIVQRGIELEFKGVKVNLISHYKDPNPISITGDFIYGSFLKQLDALGLIRSGLGYETAKSGK